MVDIAFLPLLQVVRIERRNVIICEASNMCLGALSPHPQRLEKRAAWRKSYRTVINHMQDEAANSPIRADRASQEEEFSLELPRPQGIAELAS